jgi:hypothetical protein
MAEVAVTSPAATPKLNLELPPLAVAAGAASRMTASAASRGLKPGKATAR